jgi:hypothetical protein
MQIELNSYLPSFTIATARCLRAWAPVLACTGLLVGLGGCSLLTIKSPERPLSTRDLNTRLLTRELSTQFVSAVELCADDVALNEKGPAVLENTLRWEIAAVTGSRRAVMQTAPLMSLLDSWALSVQMAAFTEPGAPGGALFGADQECVRKVSHGYASSSAELAQRLLPAREFSADKEFVETYAREHPLEDLRFARVSVVEQWSRQKGAELKLIDSVGTVPEALTDVADRLQIYGDMLPAQVVWKTQLAVRQSGYSSSDVQSLLKELDARLAAMTAVADAAPEHVQDAVADLRGTLLEVIARMDAAAAATITRVGIERVALVADLTAERAATLAAVDAQRRAVTLDAARIGKELVLSTGEQARRLAREVLLWLIVLAVLVISLPFVAGYLVGRARHMRP